jgi:hypothetical protein
MWTGNTFVFCPATHREALGPDEHTHNQVHDEAHESRDGGCHNLQQQQQQQYKKKGAERQQQQEQQ